MIVIRESAARRLVTPVDAMNAVESAFKHVAQRDATNFQVVWERLLPGSDGFCRNKEARESKNGHFSGHAQNPEVRKNAWEPL